MVLFSKRRRVCQRFRVLVSWLIVFCLWDKTNRFAFGVFRIGRYDGRQQVFVTHPPVSLILPDQVRNVDISNKTIDPEFRIYVPEYLEIRASSWTTIIHGIYVRDKDKQKALKSNRPVWRQISIPHLLLYWVSWPIEKWIISYSPTLPSKSMKGRLEYVEPFGELHSASPIPGFSRGWFVYPENGDLRIQEAFDSDKREGGTELSFIQLSKVSSFKRYFKIKEKDRARGPKSFESLSTTDDSFSFPDIVQLYAPNGAAMQQKQRTRVLKFDPNVICDESRPGTRSLVLEGTVRTGCPGYDNKGVWGLRKWKVDPCRPPATINSDEVPPVLDFQMFGADGMMNNTLWTWAGYFLRRPFFELRSPLNTHPPFMISEIRGDVGYLWAEGLASSEATPNWYISKELGNKHASQLFAKWHGRKRRTKTPADWPAQKHFELDPHSWVLVRGADPVKPVERVDQHAMNQYPTNLKPITIRAFKPSRKWTVCVMEAPNELNGMYYYVGEYMGYPFYRQVEKKGLPGYVMFRGFALAGDRDTWIIGVSLGSTDGLLAYVYDPHARLANHITSKWNIWDKEEWVVTRMSVSLCPSGG